MKILAVMKNWLGDLLFQMPALELIKQKYPSAEIFCVAPERCREILEAHPAVSGFIPFDEKASHRSWLSRIRFILELRKLGDETFRVIDQNYTLAVTSDLIAAGLVVLGILNPVAAGLIHMIHFGGIALSSLSLITPSPRISSSVN